MDDSVDREPFLRRFVEGSNLDGELAKDAALLRYLLGQAMEYVESVAG